MLKKKMRTKPRRAERIRTLPEFRSLIPPLSPEELAGLEASLVAEGRARDALVVWQEKQILLDGHHRHSICERLGLPYTVRGLSFQSKDPAKSWMIRNQLGRRNLSETQRSLLAARIATLSHGVNKGTKDASIEASSQKDAAAMFHVSRPSVQRARKVLERGVPELIAACQADKLAVSVAAEIAELPADRQKKLAANPPSAKAIVKELKAAKKDKRVRERAEQKAAAVASNHPLAGERSKLLCGDLLEAGREIADESVDAIITDPPYPEEYLPVYGRLSELAARVLRPGGNCLVMVGQSYLPEVLAELKKHLTYQWELAYLTPGATTQVFARHVKCNWKPLIWLTKGKCDWEHVQDVITSDAGDKEHHNWGQSLTGMRRIVQQFTVQKSVVLDPFVGGGATAVAALELDRLFVGIDIDEAAVKETAKRLAAIGGT